MNISTAINIAMVVVPALFIWLMFISLRGFGLLIGNWSHDRKQKSKIELEILKAKLKDLQDREVRRNIKWRKGINLEDF